MIGWPQAEGVLTDFLRHKLYVFLAIGVLCAAFGGGASGSDPVVAGFVTARAIPGGEADWVHYAAKVGVANRRTSARRVLVDVAGIDGAGVRVLRHSLSRVLPGGSAEWMTCCDFAARLEWERVREWSVVRVRSVVRSPPDVAISGLSVEPDEDEFGVLLEVSATVANRGRSDRFVEAWVQGIDASGFAVIDFPMSVLVPAGQREPIASVHRLSNARGNRIIDWQVFDIVIDPEPGTPPGDDVESTDPRPAPPAQGSTEAHVLLGLQHALGHGVPVDHREAESWFRKAFEAGSEDAFELLRLLREGRLTTPRLGP